MNIFIKDKENVGKFKKIECLDNYLVLRMPDNSEFSIWSMNNELRIVAINGKIETLDDCLILRHAAKASDE